MTASLPRIATYILGAGMAWSITRQCRKPAGWLGRALVWTMNRSHSHLTAWGLQHVQVGSLDVVLDVGCGGGRTVQRLAQMAGLGKVYGVDYSAASVAASARLNRAAVDAGRVEIHQATVSQLPFPEGRFDLVTAVETHYYWPNLPGDMREIYRVLKPGGSVLLVAEAYRHGGIGLIFQPAMKLLGGVCLSEVEHRELLVKTGYSDVQVFVEPKKGWICATGRKELESVSCDSLFR